jgi:hypothetical protein
MTRRVLMFGVASVARIRPPQRLSIIRCFRRRIPIRRKHAGCRLSCARPKVSECAIPKFLYKCIPEFLGEIIVPSLAGEAFEYTEYWSRWRSGSLVPRDGIQTHIQTIGKSLLRLPQPFSQFDHGLSHSIPFVISEPLRRLIPQGASSASSFFPQIGGWHATSV